MACFNLEIKTENIDTEKIDRAQGSTQDSLLGLRSPEAREFFAWCSRPLARGSRQGPGPEAGPSAAENCGSSGDLGNAQMHACVVLGGIPYVTQLGRGFLESQLCCVVLRE